MAWLVGAGLAAALACTLLVWAFQPGWWRLAGFFWYTIPANTFLHLPFDPAVLYVGSLYSPWVVALVAGLATVIAGAVDYFAVKKLFRLKRIAKIKEAAIYKTAVRCFYWRPWATIVVFALAPLPYDAIRILAPTSSYPFWRYASATFVGRVSRFYLLAMGGAWLAVPPIYFVPAALLVLLTPLVMFAWVKIASLRRRAVALPSQSPTA